jgi:SAM-dependent methyltransferase
LRLFSRSLKKRQKLDLLLRQIGNTSGRRCLLVTNGDNNGALNWHFREHGGDWTWVENEDTHIAQMAELLGEEVLKGEPDRIPVEGATCDVVVSIDVHEHLDDCRAFNRELKRIAKPGGLVVVTTPNGDSWKPVTLLKRLVGMSRQHYGHVVIGYNVEQHKAMLTEAGLEPLDAASYSKFFTEMIELAINFTYVKVFSGRGRAQVREGTIAPSSAEQLRAVEKQYRLYAMAYPLLYAVSRLDALLLSLTGYAVSVRSRRPA